MSGPWLCHQCSDGCAIMRQACPRCDHLKCALCQHLELVHQSRLDNDEMLRGSSVFGGRDDTLQLPGDMDIDAVDPHPVFESLSGNQISAGVPVNSSGDFEDNTSTYGQSASQAGVEQPKEHNQPQESTSQPGRSSSAYYLQGHVVGENMGQIQYTNAVESPQQLGGVSQPQAMRVFTLPIRLARGVEPGGGSLGNDKKSA